MAFLDQTSHSMAIQFGSPASVVPSPGTTAEYSPTIGMYSSTGESLNQARPATPSHLGSPHDFPQRGYLEHVVAYDNTPYWYGSIQHTNSIMAPLCSPPLAQQNRAILALLERGTAPLLISQCVETFKHMVFSNNLNGLAYAAWSGNLQYLAIVATIPTEELPGRVLQVVHLSAHLFVEPPPNGVYEPVDDSRPSTKRGHSDEISPQAQASKKPRASRKGKEPAQPAIVRRGCPGNGWKCKPHEGSTRKYWESKTGFENHFTASHMEECADGFRWKCPLHVRGCARSFAGNGSDLLDHLWNHHWQPVEPSQ